MTQLNPTISVVVPLYNGARFIEKALESVLRQSLDPFEIIVVNDGSTDGGCAIVEAMQSRIPIQLIHKNNGGQSSARNLGIKRATGSHIALLDQDDLWYHDHLEHLVKPFVDNPGLPIGWTYSNLDEIDEAGNLVARSVLHKTNSSHPKTDLLACLRHDMFILPSASLIAKHAFDTVGGFDERLSGYEDDDLFVRMFTSGYHNIYIDKALSQWRIYASSTSFSPNMARSRMIYARKLVESYPDDAFRNLFYARDLIVPRFAHEVTETLRRALRARNKVLADTCREHMTDLRALAGSAARLDLHATNPVMTAVIALFNGEATIEATLRTVFGQSRPADEIIVVDAGSDDAGPAIISRLAEEHPIIFIQISGKGRHAAWNEGVRHAHGDLIAFVSHNELWHPAHLEELVRPFTTSPDRSFGWAYCDYDIIDNGADIVSRSVLQNSGTPHPRRNLPDCLKADISVPAAAMVIARDTFELIGGFDATLKDYAEEDFFTRLVQAGYDNAFIHRTLCKRRMQCPETIGAANGRIAYVLKLSAAFPRTADQDPDPFQDFVIPRFVHQAVQRLQQVLHNRDVLLAGICRREIDELEELIDTPDRERRLRPALVTSVIIPLFNGADTIEEALHSVLAQARQPDEIIVVDDGSTDDGPERVARLAINHPIRLLFKQNGGQSSARNFGIRHAHGDLIALLDQDDIWYSTHLQELIKPFEQPRTKPLGWTYSNLDEIDRHGHLVATAVLNVCGTEHPKTNVVDALRRDMFILPSASVISRRAFEAVGGFDERLTGYEDDDLFLRMLQAGYDNAYCPAALSRWRVYPESASFSPRMANSRMIFVRKLIEFYPDDKSRHIFYTRDLIVPRFLHHIAENLRRALRDGNAELADRCAADLNELQQLVGESDRHRMFRENLLVTAVLVLRDGAATVARALQSVLAQAHRPDEIIVVDDGSVDNGPDIVKAFGDATSIQIINGPNLGLAAARNAGARHAHGDVIAFIDQDTEWYPGHLADLMKPFQDRKSYLLGWTYSEVDEFNPKATLAAQPGKGHRTSHPKRTADDFLRDELQMSASASLISKAAFDAVGGFDDRLAIHDEDDLFLRLMQSGYENAFVAHPLSRQPVRPAPTLSRRVAESRMVFVRKLMEAFPDDPGSDTSPLRDLVAPRLADEVLADTRCALKAGDEQLIQECAAQLAFFDSYLSSRGDSPLSSRQPLISAIIPVYNGAAHLREAVASVFSQTLPPDEVITVDDGSTDNSLAVLQELAREYPIRIIQRENGGQSAARNIGVEHARGDLLAFLDQDDIWLPNHLAELVKPFRQSRALLGWSYSDLDEIDEAGDLVCRGVIRRHHSSAHPKLDLVNCLRQDMFILPSATLISRQAFLQIGGFNERLSGYEDDDLFLRLFRAGYDSAFLPESLSRWRIYQSSSSYSPRMAVSRLAYARLLIDRYPDNPTRSLYYVRDLIAPRFFRSMSVDFRRCVLIGDKQQQKVTLDHLAFIVRHLRSRWRLPLAFVVIPLLRLPPVRRFIAPRRLPAMRMFRGMN